MLYSTDVEKAKEAISVLNSLLSPEPREQGTSAQALTASRPALGKPSSSSTHRIMILIWKVHVQNV